MYSALFLSVLLVPAEGPATYKLGGPRQVVAVVRMLPVTAFDDATNDRLNRLKAEHYAMQGLAKHLSREKNVHFEIAGGRVVASAKDGKTYALTFRVPRKNVVLLRPDAEAPATKSGTVRFAFDTPFFTRKRDLIDTGKQLGESLRTDLSAAEKKVNKTPESVEAFVLQVAVLEERGEKHWKKLREEVKADRFLLTLESDEVLESLKQRETAWVEALTASAEKISTAPKGDE